MIEGKAVVAAGVVGVVSLVVIVAFRHWWPRVPGILIAVVGASAVTAALGLAAHGVAVVGPIPAGLPQPTFPDVSLHDVTSLIVAAAGMAFVTLADTTVVSRSLAA